jgi:hypothetical protein
VSSYTKANNILCHFLIIFLEYDDVSNIQKVHLMAVKAESELNKKKRFLPSATFSNNKVTFNFKVA